MSSKSICSALTCGCCGNDAASQDRDGVDGNDNGPLIVRVRIRNGDFVLSKKKKGGGIIIGSNDDDDDDVDEGPPEPLQNHITPGDWHTLRLAIRKALKPAVKHNKTAKYWMYVGLAVLVLGMVFSGISGWWCLSSANHMQHDCSATLFFASTSTDYQKSKNSWYENAFMAMAIGLLVGGMGFLLLVQIVLVLRRKFLLQPIVGENLRQVLQEFSTPAIHYHLLQDGSAVANLFYRSCSCGTRDNDHDDDLTSQYIGTNFALIVTVQKAVFDYQNFQDGSTTSSLGGTSSSLSQADDDDDLEAQQKQQPPAVVAPLSWIGGNSIQKQQQNKKGGSSSLCSSNTRKSRSRQIKQQQHQQHNNYRQIHDDDGTTTARQASNSRGIAAIVESFHPRRKSKSSSTSALEERIKNMR